MSQCFQPLNQMNMTSQACKNSIDIYNATGHSVHREYLNSATHNNAQCGVTLNQKSPKKVMGHESNILNTKIKHIKHELQLPSVLKT